MSLPVLTPDTAPKNSFVLPDHKILYMSVTKAACTSVRWMLAHLGGEDPASFSGGTGAVQSKLMTIHGGRDRWQRTPQLTDLSAPELADISPENGWFVFALVRDPWSRFWSAWESKFLVRHNSYLRRFADEPFFPRVPRHAEEVVEDFRRFVELHPWTTDERLMSDVHFWPQARSVLVDRVPYTRIYDVRQFGELTSDLHAHLHGLGLDSELYAPRANETPLGLTREVMSGGVKEAIEYHYSDDFDLFGDRWSFEDLKFVPDGWNADALAHAEYHTVANEWIGELSDRAREHRARARQHRESAGEHRARVGELSRERGRLESELRRERHRARELEQELRRRSLAGRLRQLAPPPAKRLARRALRR